jgi:hypothetical protein
MVAKYDIANADSPEDRIAALLSNLEHANNGARSVTDLIYRSVDNGTAGELLPATISDGLARVLEAQAEIERLIEGFRAKSMTAG